MRSLYWAASALILCTANPAAAQIAVSANDGKQDAANPDGTDSISVLDLSARPVRILSTIAIPTSMIGPPASVALTESGDLAVVTASLKRDDSAELAPNDVVSVVDISAPSQPQVVQTLHAGENASGIALSPRGDWAAVANRAGDSVTLFRIDANRLSRIGDIYLGQGSSPVDVGFSADGRSAYVVANGDDRLLRLNIGDETVSLTAQAADLGRSPYSMTINDASSLAYVTNLGGRRNTPTERPATGTMSIVDLSTMRELEQIDLGNTPEHLAISPRGDFVQATLINGSNANPDSPGYRDHGYLKVFAVDGQTLRQVAETRTGKWCQGAAWSSDQERIVLQCADQSELEIYQFSGTTLTRSEGETLQLDARPGSIATARDR